jgi:hypothetical protein
MQYRPRCVFLAAMLGAVGSGCVDGGEADPDPRDECELEKKPKVLDIELTGLDDTRSYRFVVEGEGARVNLTRTPEQLNTFGEALLPAGGALVASLDGGTMRVFVDQTDRAVGPTSVRLEAWTRAGQVIAATFMPAYEHAVPVAGDCFSTITEHLALPPHE